MTDRVNRPHKKPGRQRVYIRDSLSKTKRGKNAIRKVEKIRLAALRAEKVSGQTLAEIERKQADRPLAEKQLMFVRYWAQGETPRTAATLAGYSDGSSGMGWKLSRDPAILKLYRAEKALYEAAQGHTKVRVMSMLQEAYDHAKLVSEPATMVAAARELGRMAGHYEPEKHIHVVGGSELLNKMNTLTDEQLLEIINREGALPGVFARIADDPKLEDKRGH
jgi:phage terminase small subunit